ncbi:hypothetical protein PF005_g12589 [Phytophthora fragariae]|uniref:Uncharacterized protein n=2 Tax=Phytophthora TaxID=4783 RepID=A0A6A4DGX6_9STRA|nr:hypothetical protein PF003_g37146 [Phytophthora fragariae]KAE9026290.1 hypothetical protein PR002_g10959 [Phytophthora rubi]KAE8936930.1 hypothetical protein PF009_g13153 [Phytophthora fragariae]KAE9001121.1 hypothetical protein PF011_g13889 [Phytophthora fragariae]KAE9031870.1 hypothetical protein PR001_g10872 [Phytophthora rubi]
MGSARHWRVARQQHTISIIESMGQFASIAHSTKESAAEVASQSAQSTGRGFSENPENFSPEWKPSRSQRYSLRPPHSDGTVAGSEGSSGWRRAVPT